MFQSGVLSWWHVAAFVFTVLPIMYYAEKHKSKIAMFIACCEMVVVSGLRHGYIDTRAYRYGFEHLDISDTLNIDYILFGSSRDRGFSVLSAIIKLFSSDGQVFLFVFAVFTVGLLFYGLVKRTDDVFLGVFLFICTGCYIDTMNGMRQAFASAVLFFILPDLIIRKKLLHYMTVVFLLSAFHGTALLLIPLYFIADKRPWSKPTWIISGFMVLLFLFFNFGIGNILFTLLEGTSYGEDYGSMIQSANTSVNVIRVFVAWAPIFLSFIYRDKEKKQSSLYNICFNMSLMNALTWLFATKVLYFYRLTMYFQPYMILLLCYIIQSIQSPRDRQIVKYCMILLYGGWHIYSLYVTGDNFFVGYLKY